MASLAAHTPQLQASVTFTSMMVFGFTTLTFEAQPVQQVRQGAHDGPTGPTGATGPTANLDRLVLIAP